MKKGIVVFLALILTVGTGFIIPILINWDVEGTPRTTARSATPDKNSSAAVANGIVTVSPEVVVSLTSPAPKYESDIKLGTPSPDNLSQNTDIKASPSPVVSKKPSAPEPTIKESVDWVERKIQEHRDEIDDDDLEDFRRLYSRVNIAYIQGIVNDGLDDEGMTQLKSYLRNTLGGDYERAKELFYKYSYLLSEV